MIFGDRLIVEKNSPEVEKCSGGLTDPRKPRQSDVARAGCHVWRRSRLRTGQLAEADPGPLIDMISTPNLLQVMACR